MHAGIAYDIGLSSYLGNGSCILDDFDEAGVRSSGDAAVRNEGKVQPFILPQLLE